MEREEHRAEAVRTYNACWDLLDAPGRTDDEDRRLLMLALASRHHWIEAGGGTQESVIADWMASRAAAAAGYGTLAVDLARGAVAAADGGGQPAWLRASAREGLARAYAAAGDAAARAVELAAAERVLAEEPDEESRELIAAQIADVPEVATPGR